MGGQVPELLQALVVAFNFLLLGYFVALNANYTMLLVFGWREVSDYVRRRPFRDYRAILESRLSMPVSIIVPAYNEEPVIAESVRALCRVDYPELEVVVMNDGSSDGTLERLIEEFALVPVERVPRARLETRPIRQVYASAIEPRLVVVDKDNGGKADALNAGLRYARYPLFCAVDSDTMLERDALARLVWHFQAEPQTVGCGGIVRIINGSTVRDARVAEVETPRSLLVNLQIVEYLRGFLAGRTGWSRLGMLLIISGAFGLFRRDVVIAAGGYDRETVGEDAELVFRLHRFCRERGRPYKISFLADPVCWTEAPGSFGVLARQRDRWQRGLIQSMSRHRAMTGNRRYGAVGLFAMPYFLVFEMIGPVIETLGYAAMALSLAAGWVSSGVAIAFFSLALAYGMILSFGALLIEERAFQRYRHWRCLARLALAGFLENFGYRQLNTAVRTRAYLTLLRRKEDWGEMVRAGYTLRPDMLLDSGDDAEPEAAPATG